MEEKVNIIIPAIELNDELLMCLKEKKTSSEQSQNELEPIEDGIPYAILEDENK